MTIYLPPSVSRELQERTRSFAQDVLDSIELDDTDTLLLEYTHRLQQIDRRLMMVRAREHVVPGVPMRPGYYHVLCRSELAPWSVTVIEGEHGEFTEPTSRVFEKLAAGDIGERRNLERYRAHEQAEHRANEREKAREREDRQDHLRELVNAYTRVSVPGTGQPWRQNQAGRRDLGERQ